MKAYQPTSSSSSSAAAAVAKEDNKGQKTASGGKSVNPHAAPAMPSSKFETSAKIIGEGKTTLIDLHGLSVEQAQAQVARYVRQARSSGWDKIRFVTGRGNHVNARGERGTLYKSFREWVQAVQGNVTTINQFDGYYEVDIKSDPFPNPFLAFMNANIVQSLKENINAIKAGAREGKVDDMLALAYCYDKGIGVDQSYQQATALHLRLAKKKNVISQYEMGCRYFIGKGIKQDDKKALKFLRLAAEQDCVVAEFQLGEIYSKGFDAFPIDHALANQYYRKAADHGQPDAARKLGCAYALGTGIKADDAQAVYWWEKAVAGKDCVAAFNLFPFYRDGKGVSKDPKKAVHCLRLSAEWGDPDGQFHLGCLLYYGDAVVKQGKTEGLKWFHQAADNNCPQAQFFLSIHYSSLGNAEKAKKYLIDAAQSGHLEAQFMIACAPRVAADASSASNSKQEKSHQFDPALQEKMLQRLLKQPTSAVLQADDVVKSMMIDLLLCEDSTKKQISKGIRILERLAEEKRHDVLDRLGSIYVLGNVKGIKKNIGKGHGYWMQGAAVNHPYCLCALGYFWQEGLGGRKDQQQAVDYFAKAAAHGNANANDRMGTFYSHDSFGVKKDTKRAAAYFQRAMELDRPNERSRKRKAFLGTQNIFKHAAKNLAMLYLKGDDDFPPDTAKAVKLFQQAAADGMEDVATFLQQLKEKMLVTLQQLSGCLVEQLDWKITTENCAWAYVSNELQTKLKAINELKPCVKKAKDGRYLIMLDNIYQRDLVEVAHLFLAASTSTSVDVKAPTLAASSSSMAANLAAFGSRAIHQSSAAATASSSAAAQDNHPPASTPVNKPAACTIM